jgi:hyperosmotically inducible periplasmic protein
MTRTMHVLAALVLTALTATGCTTMTGRTAGANADDAGTTAAVKSKLVADRPTNLTTVNVDTVNGTVYLTGAVDRPEHRIRAEELAWQARGVRQVVNNLQVRQPGTAVVVPRGAVSASPATPTRQANVGTVLAVDTARNQVTVRSGNEQLLMQLPAAVVSGLRPGDTIWLSY